MPPPRLRVATCTDPGARGGNEDDLRHGSTAVGHFAVVADGAGGHARGEEASYRAVECVARGLSDSEAIFQPATLTALAYLAHEDLLRALRGARRPEQRMHTTLVVLWLDAGLERALWAHVGDSRLYRVRGGHCEALTKDDSVVQHMVRSGLLTEAQGRTHPNKNQLLAALGVDGDITPHTSTEAALLSEGDAFLLCSDGWWDAFEPADIAAALARAGSPEEWLDDMRRQIVRRASPKQDNYTAIALWLGEEPRPCGADASGS
jgi:serine/threonine protein phosphatase PrpC